jgi:predicted dehydrogenase
MSTVSRRRFLEDSMFAAAAAVAAGSAGELFAQQEPQQSASPNERLGAAVVGTRWQGNSHLSAFSGRKDTEVLYVVDCDERIGRERVDQVAERQGRKPKWVADMREAFDDKAVDIVSTATPNHWHALVSIWAMQAGKDVYVEKPVSHNVSEGRRMVEVARKLGRICQTGTQCRSNPGMQAMMKYLHDGNLGKVNVGRGLCYKRRNSIGPRGEYQPPQNVNYDLWLGPAPIAPVTRPQFHYDWHWQWPYGNGDLGNQGIHQMDLARWGLGVDRLSDAVFSYGGRLGYEDAGDTPNTQTVVHDYGDQTLVFEVRGLSTKDFKGSNVGVIFECAEGYLVVGSYDSGAAFDSSGTQIKSFRGGGNHFENFIRAVRSRKHEDLNADILEGHLSSALCHMGNISYVLGSQTSVSGAAQQLDSIKSTDNLKQTFERFCAHLVDNKIDLDKTQLTFGPVLAFDPGSETFKGNAQANTLLTREYRKPYVVPDRA